MAHAIYRVISFQLSGSYTVRVCFDDNTEQIIDFSPVLKGEIYGPLKDTDLFRRVEIDPEIHTLVWPNGADFDPETLHDWPRYLDSLAELADGWSAARISS
jgi:hypothetical protein